MVAQAVQSPEPSPQIPVLITKGIVSYYNPSNGYDDDDTPVVAPELPDQHDATTSFYFRGNLTSLLPQPVPTNVDENMVSKLQELPSRPPIVEFGHSPTSKATVVRRVWHNATVEIVFQNPYSSDLISNTNPMHLHGHDFFILGQGLGRYDELKDVQAYNLVDPPARNTALVPIYGWIAIRFVACNPGTYVHFFDKEYILNHSMDQYLFVWLCIHPKS
jgi:laccase